MNILNILVYICKGKQGLRQLQHNFLVLSWAYVYQSTFYFILSNTNIFPSLLRPKLQFKKFRKGYSQAHCRPIRFLENLQTFFLYA